MERGRGVRRESPLHRLLAATCQLAPVTEMWGNYVIAALVTCLHRYPGKAIYPRSSTRCPSVSFVVHRGQDLRHVAKFRASCLHSFQIP